MRHPGQVFPRGEHSRQRQPRSLVNAFLGKVPGKTSRLDTATRMMIDADFSLRREVPSEARPTVSRTPVNKRRLEEQK